MVSGAELFYILLLITLTLIGVYFLTMKRRRRLRIHESHSDWKVSHQRPLHELSHTVFLIGDSGAPLISHPDPVLTILRSKLKEKGNKASVIFLGDNIYPLGLPPENDPGRKLAERRLVAQLDMVRDHPGGVYMISGNHDWRRGRKGGMKTVVRQEKFVESYLGRKGVFLPSGAQPGPVEVELSSDLTVIFINTVWWLYRSWRKRSARNRELDEKFFSDLEQMLERNLHRHVLLAAHHPIYSKSFHGGKFSLKQHLFPLTELGKKWYIPLPGAGSLYPLYRKYIGSVEDMAHPRYRQLRSGLLNILSGYHNLLYAAGHDHNLQYMKRRQHHYIVSGSGSKVSYVRGSDNAIFTHAHKGFFEIGYYRDGSQWMGVWEPDASGKAVLAFSRLLPYDEAILSPATAGEGRESA